MESDFRMNSDYRNPPLWRKMKSTSKVTETANATNGTSKSAATGGFDALLVGYVGSGSRNDFGTGTLFWASSSRDGSSAWLRGLDYAEPGVARGVSDRWYRFSVRCKKDN
jgi:uncharacterized protein (TIGR02145 family)